MATDIKMPQLSDTMYSGKILAWKKAVGDSIKRGDILAEVETDKANLEIESFHEGTLIDIKVAADSTAAVGDTICVIGSPGEATSTSNGATKSSIESQPTQSSAPQPIPSAQPAPRMVSPSHGSTERIVASPLAKKMASDLSVDLSTLRGSGPHGRIIRRDIESAASRGPVSKEVVSNLAPQHSQKSAPSIPSRSPDPIPTGGRLTALSKMRDTIARRMQQSVTESPHFYVSTSVRMEQVTKLREVLKAKPEYKGISVNHFVIKACAYGLANEPSVNAAYRDGSLYEPDGINIGVITAIPDGLLIPVIKDADKLSLRDVVFEARAAVERAKAGRPSSQDLMGGTFSISNMGMFDVDTFTAIINPGQGGVLAVSAIKEEPVVERGHIVPGLVMRVTVSVDHRVIDGVMAAQFLKFFKEALEQPALIM